MPTQKCVIKYSTLYIVVKTWTEAKCLLIMDESKNRFINVINTTQQQKRKQTANTTNMSESQKIMLGDN